MTKRLWRITDKGDPWVLRLVDGREVSPKVLAMLGVSALDIHPHYSRQQPGTPSFTRNGQNLVFVTEDCTSAWVTFRPTPGKAVRPDGLDVWECAMFRNEGPHLSSEIIREAVALTCALWGWPPLPRTVMKTNKKGETREVFSPGGIITYVRPDKVASGLPGYCYRRAGWRRVSESADGKPMFRAPRLPSLPDWRSWGWHCGRGGKLRRELEQPRLLEVA